ncbi:MAG: alkaline phosphatase [Bacteroidales bacterium]
MKRIGTLLLAGGLGLSAIQAQDKLTYHKEEYNQGDTKVEYIAPNPHKLVSMKNNAKGKRPKNIILLIGDGMGASQVYAAFMANRAKLNIMNMPFTGFSKTYSANDDVTDSAAGGTALSSGKKTYNGALGVVAKGKDTIAIKTILELAEEKGLETGLVSSCAVTHATPASFIAHQNYRSYTEDIALDFLGTDVDVVIGGGYKYFTNRKDGKNLINELKEKGYNVVRGTADDIAKAKGDKLYGFTAEKHPAKSWERDYNLIPTANKALSVLSDAEKGFFLMIEGSQIDWGGHANDLKYTVEETLEFDQVVGNCINFADSNGGETLIIITADHETGGLAIKEGDMKNGLVKADWTTNDHSGIMVPVYAYGPGAENFTGIMENTAIFDKMKELLGL